VSAKTSWTPSIWFHFPIKATGASTSHPGLCDLSRRAIYLIVYAPDESPLLVIAAIHGRRSPRVIAAMLRDREPE
jgi:hypothetical protein